MEALLGFVQSVAAFSACGLLAWTGKTLWALDRKLERHDVQIGNIEKRVDRLELRT